MKQALSIPREKSAAVFIDLQEEHRGDPASRVEGYETILANAARLQAAAREAGLALFHFAYVVDLERGLPRPFHPVTADGASAFSDKNDPLSAICHEVAPAGNEKLSIKSAASAFRDGTFEPKLRERGIEWLILCGVWTEACVDATVKDAVERGFRVLLVKDACGSGTAMMHQTGVLNLANRLYGGAVIDTARACRLIAGESVDAWRVEGVVPLRYDLGNASALYGQL